MKRAILTILMLIIFVLIIFLFAITFTSIVSNLVRYPKITEQLYNQSPYPVPRQLDNMVMNVWADVSRFIISVMLILFIVLIIVFFILWLEGIATTCC